MWENCAYPSLLSDWHSSQQSKSLSAIWLPSVAASSTCSILTDRIWPKQNYGCSHTVLGSPSWLDALGWEGTAAWRPPRTPRGVLLNVNATKYMNHAQQLAFLDDPKSKDLTPVTTERWFWRHFSQTEGKARPCASLWSTVSEDPDVYLLATMRCQECHPATTGVCRCFQGWRPPGHMVC